MKVAILFGDNDFSNTFIPLLTHLNLAYHHYGKLPEDKETLVKFINELAPNMYLLFQNQDEINGMEWITEGLKTGLAITVNDILVNNEVDEYLKTMPNDNSSTYILDTDIMIGGKLTGYVWSI